MRRELHVRFCEGGGVRFPSATRLVMEFEHRQDAERCLAAWQTRLEPFGLALHPDKTRLLEFGRFAAMNRQRRGAGKPETFDFLGFTPVCGTTRRTGKFMVHRRPARKRLRTKLKRVKLELQQRWHEAIPQVGAWLQRVVRGYFNYHAVAGNLESLSRFRTQLLWLWLRTLRRRGQRRPLTWARFGPIAARWIPGPRILHPYPDVRFAASHPR